MTMHFQIIMMSGHSWHGVRNTNPEQSYFFSVVSLMLPCFSNHETDLGFSLKEGFCLITAHEGSEDETEILAA